jgi:hypothetical protein
MTDQSEGSGCPDGDAKPLQQAVCRVWAESQAEVAHLRGLIQTSQHSLRNSILRRAGIDGSSATRSDGSDATP